MSKNYNAPEADGLQLGLRRRQKRERHLPTRGCSFTVSTCLTAWLLGDSLALTTDSEPAFA
jgi:hypothetical protein